MTKENEVVIGKLFDFVEDYCKKNGLSFILGAGKMMPDGKYFAGDVFHQEKDNDIFYISQILIKKESIGIAIAAAILQSGKEMAHCFSVASKDIH